MKNWEIALTGTWPAAAVLGLGVLAAALSYVFYRRKKRSLPARVFRLLSILRILGIVLVTLFLLKPVIRYSHTQKEDTQAVVLIDVSESMSIQDATGGRSRLEAALNLLREEPHQVLRELARTQKVRLFAFGPYAAEVRPDAALQATQSATAIGEALKEAVSRIGESSLSGVVLLSDGVNTTGEDPLKIARFLGVPVYGVAVGGRVAERGKFVDIGIASTPHNLEFIVNNKATLAVRLSNYGLPHFAAEERLLDLALTKGDQALARQSVQFPRQDGTQEVKVEFTPKQVGIHKLTLSLPKLPGEVIEENNTRNFTVRVTDPKIRTLIVEGVPREEYRFLRRVLESDPNVELTSMVKLRRDRFYLQGVDRGVDLTRGLPSRKEDFQKFDVVIVGDIARDEFTEGQIRGLKDFVAEGGGLLSIGGYHAYGPGDWAASALADVLPVRMGGKLDGHVEETFAPRLTAAGREHPVFEGCTDFFAEGSQRALLSGANRVTGGKPGATVLAVHPTERVGAEPLPIVVIQRFGGGQVLSLTADTTWKWKFQLEARGLDSPYYKFWRQSVRWLAGRKSESPEGKEFVTAWPTKVEYKFGENVVLEAQVRGRDKEPFDNATVKAQVHYPAPIQKENSRGGKYTEEAAGVEFQHMPLSLGQYQATFQPPVDGIYRAVVSASDGQGVLGQAEFEFVVGEATTEFDRVDADEFALRAISSETGGQFHTLATAGRIPQELEKRRRSITYHEDLNPWKAPGPFYLAFLTCVALEWIVRKKFALS